MEQSVSEVNAKPHQGLNGRALVAYALDVGESFLEGLGPEATEIKYFKAISRRVGVEFPPGFFASTLEELMGPEPDTAVDQG